MTRREFEGWQAYDALYPIGHQGEWAAAAYREAKLFNARYATERDPMPIKEWRALVPEFLLKQEVEEKEARRRQAEQAQNDMAIRAWLEALP